MATIHIKDLKLRCIIGANDWEREEKQDIIINVNFDYDAARAKASDNLNDSVDYKVITKDIISFVETSEFILLEKLCHEVLQLVLTDSRVKRAEVRIDKPFALRFSQSVSCTLRHPQTS